MFISQRRDGGHAVNPRHLFTGTHEDHMVDMVRQGRLLRCPGEMNSWGMRRTSY